MKKKIPHRNQSPYGWWVASILTRYEEEGEDATKMSRRCLAWEDTIILKAADREEAYEKAIREGKNRESSTYDSTNEKTGKKGKWVFEGLTSLLPIYEELEDGAEIIWNEHYRSAKKIKSWLRKRANLRLLMTKIIDCRTLRVQGTARSLPPLTRSVLPQENLLRVMKCASICMNGGCQYAYCSQENNR